MQQDKWSKIARPADWTNIPGFYNTTVGEDNTAVDIINNAMTTKFNGLRIVNLLAELPGQKFKIQCPITSILDSQGSFGSCTGRKVLITNNLDISIETQTDGNSITDFVFTMELIHKPNGKTILSYTLQCKEFFIGPEITTQISKNHKTLNILSANNSFSDVLLQIENYGMKKNINVFDNEDFDNEDLKKSIMASLSKKFMGDFSQELNSIIKGNLGMGKWFSIIM